MLPKTNTLACSLYQVSVGVELGLVCKPVERATCLGDRCRRQLLGIPDLDQHMHPGVGGNAAADQLGRNLPGLGVKNNSLASHSLTSRPFYLESGVLVCTNLLTTAGQYISRVFDRRVYPCYA
jgi:hypothetical protein